MDFENYMKENEKNIVEKKGKEIFVKVKYPNNTVLVEEKKLIATLKNEPDVERLNYKNFQLIIKSIKQGTNITNYYCGYIKYEGEKLELVEEILCSEEIENLVPGGWTGTFEGALGFDCAHIDDERISAVFNPDSRRYDEYIAIGTRSGRDCSFKSKEYVLSILKNVADNIFI